METQEFKIYKDDTPSRKVYISGKITGQTDEFVAAKFTEAERYIAAFKMQPVNPLKNGLPPDASYKEHMRRDLQMLSECQTILMLPDWKSSPGACEELQYAYTNGIEILFL